jgi:TP901 family phage tail tape measure protein
MADVNANIGVNIDTSDALNQLKNLQRQISQFHQSVAKSSSAAGIAQRDLQKNFINGVNAIQGFSAELRTVRTSAESFTNSLEKNKFSIQQYFRYAASQTKTFGKNFSAEFSTIEKVAIERVKTLQTQYVKMGRDAQGAMQAIAIRPTVLNMKDLGTQTAIAAQKQVLFNQLVKQGSTNLLNFGKNTQWAGRQLMVGFTLPLATLGMTAGRVFMDMEKAALKFKKVYGDLFTAPGETEKALDSIVELGLAYTKYGVAVSESLDVAAEAAAAGFQGVDLQNQTTASLKLSVLGQMELQKALQTTIALQNAFRISSADLAGEIDFLNAVENQTVVSLDDITEAVPRVAPVIQALGGDVRDLAFFLAAMKEGGVNAAQGANALKSGLASLINPTERAAEMLGSMGINIRQIVSQNQGDLRGTVIGFARALDTLDPMRRAQAIEQLFGKFQFARISALFDNVIKDGSQASRVLDLAGSSLEDLATLSEKELGVSAASAMNKFRASIEQVKVALAPLGELFLEIATPFIDFATTVLKAFNNLPDGIKKILGTVITVIGGLGPVLLMTFGLINNGIANMIKFFATVRLGYLKMTGQAKGIGDETQYMTQEQLEAAAAAASLDQAHAGLTQRFTAEKTAVDALRDAYSQAAAAGARFATLNPGMMKPGSVAAPTKMAKGGIVTVGGRGNKDTEPALLTPGEAVIPTEMVKRYAPLIEGMIAGNIPGYAKGVMLGMPKSAKSVSKNRDAAEEVYQMFLKSSYAGTAPTNYGHQISPTSGHSFPIFGLGGVYQKGNKQVFVKPVLDEKTALAEMRSTEISRRAHGLEAPQQRIVVIKDPMDVKGVRRFLALESDLDPKFVNNQPMGVFNEDQYFKQLVASLLRVDKDLSGANVFGNVVADAGPAGVFSRASGLRDYEKSLPSMEDQAIINLLGIKGGAKRAFAESTLGLMAGLTPEQYKSKMLGEIQKVLPRLKETIASFKLTNPTEVGVYDDMVRRLEQGLGVDWSKFHAIHSAVKPAKPKAKTQAIPGYKDGIVSVPGPKGAGDVIAAMLAPGEAVIPAAMAKKYAPLIEGMVSGSIPGYVDGLTAAGEKQSAGYESYESRKSKTVPKSREAIDALLPGQGAEAQKLIANAGVSNRNAIRIMSQLAETAEQGAEAYESTITKLKELIAAAAKVKNDPNIVKSSGQLAKDLRSETGFISKNQSTNKEVFAHIGDGVKIAVSEALAKIKTGELIATESEKQKLEKILAEKGPGFGVDIKSGLGIQGISKEVNRALAQEGADIGAFKDEFDSLGIEKWNKSIEFGGGNVKELAAQTQLLDQQFSKLLAQVERGTLIFDKEADAKAAVARGQKAVSVESLYGQSRANVKGQAPGLVNALDTAQGTASQLRSKYGGLNTPGLKNRGKVSELEQQAKIEQDAYNAGKAAASTPQDDSFVVSQDDSKRASPHQDAAALGKKDQEAYNKGAESAVKKIDTRKIRRISSDPAEQARIDEINRQRTQATQDSASVAAGTSRQPRRARAPQGPASAPKPGEPGFVGPLLQQPRVASQFTDNLSKASLAISSVTGILYMFGNDLGGIIPAISGISAAMFGLISISQALQGTFIATAAAARATSVANAMGAASIGQLFVKGRGLAGLFTNIGTALKVGLRFLGPIGIALSALAIALPFVINLYQKQRDKMEAFGKIVDVTADQIKFLGQQAGEPVTTTSGFSRATLGQAETATDAANEKSADEQFLEQFKTQIAATKAGALSTVNEALEVLAFKLSSAGLSDQVVSSTIAGIIQASKRTDLEFDFNKVGLSPSNTAGLLTDLRSRVATATEVQQTEGYQATFNRGPAAQSTQELKDVGTNVAAIMEGLATQLEGRIITIEEYSAAFNELRLSLVGLEGTAKETAIDEAINKIFPEDKEMANAIKGVEDLEQQMLLLELAGVGGSDSMQEFVDKTKDGTTSKAQYVTQIKKEIAAQKQLNDIKELDIISEEQVSEADAIRDKIAVYDELVAAGLDAAEAYRIAGDAALTEGYKTALAAGDLQLWIDGVNEIAALTAQFESRKPISGGGGQKSPFQEAIDSLKEQQKEAKNSIMAYAKLRSAGLGVAEASEIAKDSMLAAALASQQVGSAKWNQLVTAIRAARAEEEAWLNSTPEGRAEHFAEVYSKVMDVFNAQEAILEMNNEAATAANRKIIETLEKQIDAYQRRSSELERDLDKIAEKETEINKTYDEKTKALEKVKKLNQDIINQQKSQLSIADALSRGDISAAASAMQDSRAQSASAQGDAMGIALDASRQSQLNALTQNGKTRAQIEEEIKQIKKDVSAIEFGALQTARDAVKAADEALETAKENIKVQGQSRTEWENINTRIDASKANAALYDAEVAKALENARGLVGEWSKLQDTFTTTHVVNTVYNGTPTAITPAPVTPSRSNQPRTTRTRVDTPAPAITPPQPSSAYNPNAAWEAKYGVASGGYISGPGTATSDSIPAMLSDGEYVIKAASVNKFGKNFLDSINAGKLLGFGKGGLATNKFAMGGLVSPKYFAMGGLVSPKYFANGGMAQGTDTVPAMLTPGEFVTNKASTKRFAPLLEAINNGNYRYSTPSGSILPNNFSQPVYNMPARDYADVGGNMGVYSTSNSSPSLTSLDNSVYNNYSLSVNVEGTNASANDIANVVINKIKTIDSQQVRRQVLR